MNFRLFELRGLFLLSSIFLWSHLCVAQSTLPPLSAVLGENNLSFSTSFSSSNVFFVEIDHPGGFFQVDTIGSNFGTELGLYNAFGELIDANGNDDDLPPGFVPLPSPVGSIGGLPAGTYYVGAAAFPSTFFSDFVVETNNTTVSGAILVVNYTNPNQAPPLANVSGTITLPAGFIPNNNDVVVAIGLFGSDGSPSFAFPNLANESVSIVVGESSVNYELDYILFNNFNEIAISFTCILNCEEVDSSSFILQDDGTFTDVFNTVPIAGFSDTIDFQFPREDTVISPILLLLLEED